MAVRTIDWPQLIQDLQAQQPPAPPRQPRTLSNTAQLLASRVSFIARLALSVIFAVFSDFNPLVNRLTEIASDAKFNYGLLILNLQHESQQKSQGPCIPLLEYIVTQNAPHDLEPKNFSAKQWCAITYCIPSLHLRQSKESMAEVLANAFTHLNAQELEKFLGTLPLPERELKTLNSYNSQDFLYYLPRVPELEYQGIAAKINHIATITVPAVGFLLGICVSVNLFVGAFAVSGLYAIGDLIYKSRHRPNDPYKDMRADLQDPTLAPHLVTLLKTYIIQSNDLTSKKLLDIHSFYNELTLADISDDQAAQKKWAEIVGQDRPLPDLRNIPKRQNR